MRPDEAFVGQALFDYLHDLNPVAILDGEDPPDLYLNLESGRIGIEVTRLSQFTIKPDGTLCNRTTEDTFGIRLIDELNSAFGPALAEDICIVIGLETPVAAPRRFRKGIQAWVEEIVSNPILRSREERTIEGARVWTSVAAARPGGKKVMGYVSNKNSSADIAFNAQLVLADRVMTKSAVCMDMQKPIWLALINDYWLADADTYKAISRELKLTHCFDRIFLISDRGSVTELEIGYDGDNHS